MNTISGALTSDSTWSTGTYLLTGGNIDLGVYNLVLDGTDDITIKTDGTSFLNVNGSGTLTTINTDLNNKVRFTSKNDDSLGEIVPGSSGSPVKGDQAASYIKVIENTTFTLRYCELWYAESELPVILLGTDVDKIALHITLYHIVFKYCGIREGSSYTVALLGLYRYWSAVVGNVNLQHIIIDTTNSVKDSANGYVVYVNKPLTFSMRDSFIYTDPNFTCALCLFISDFGSSTSPIFDNIFCKSKTSLSLALIGVFSANTLNIGIRNCAFIQEGSSEGLLVSNFAGTVTFNIKDNYFIGATTGLTKQALVPTTFNESNNGYYDNQINAAGFTPTDPILADPELGNVPGGSIAEGWFLPDGFAVTNLTDYEKKGSDTFNNLSIDESLYSMTGFEYSGEDKVTPGIYYKMDDFAYSVNFYAGVSGSLIGNTSQTIFHDSSTTAVRAEAFEGYDFSTWSGSNTSTINPLTLTNVTGNMAIRANFVREFDKEKMLAGSRGGADITFDTDSTDFSAAVFGTRGKVPYTWNFPG